MLYRMFLAPVALVVVMGGIAYADDQSEAGAILDRAIRATGGEAALSQIKATQCKAKGIGYEGDKKVPMSYWLLQEVMQQIQGACLANHCRIF